MHTCLNGGLLFGERLPLPEVPWDYAAAGCEVGCTTLRCGLCQHPVLSVGGATLRPGSGPTEAHDLYRRLASGSSDSPLLVPARGARQWVCACGVAFRVDDARAPVGLDQADLDIPPPPAWRCAAHPPFSGDELDGEVLDLGDAAATTALVHGAILGKRARNRPVYTSAYPAQWVLRLSAVLAEPRATEILVTGLACAFEQDPALVGAGLDLWRRRPDEASRAVDDGRLPELDAVTQTDGVTPLQPESLQSLYAESLASRLSRASSVSGPLIAAATRHALGAHHPRLITALFVHEPDALLAGLDALVVPRPRVGVLGALVLGAAQRRDRAPELFAKLTALGVAGAKLDALRAQHRV